MVGHPLMVRLIFGLIPHGKPIELFLVPANAPRLVKQRPWYVLFCWSDGALIRVAHVMAMWFLSDYLSGPLPLYLMPYNPK